ncbi:hypothetical protein RRG08_065521 [Elysia crispata]|uniref:Uncharacterized protein n=1 Tax=Elysia crispata TaxID=231223 RepID=A0AAE1DAN7_9GAST|nr:hypothetical protein RRG08_065521 [Elysia crispata]
MLWNDLASTKVAMDNHNVERRGE